MVVDDDDNGVLDDNDSDDDDDSDGDNVRFTFYCLHLRSYYHLQNSLNSYYSYCLLN